MTTTAHRSDSLDLAGLQAFARQFAVELPQADPRSPRWARPGHLKRLRAEAQVLEQAYRAFADDVRQAEPVSPAAEWLLDNFHLIANEVASIAHDLPGGYYRRLPKVKVDGSRSLARIELLAVQTIRRSDGRIDAERLREFLLAFESVTPLTIGELWAWPSMLKAALISYVSEIAEGMRRARADAASCRRLPHCPRRQRTTGRVPLDEQSSFPYVVRLLQRIREYGAQAATVRADLDAWLTGREMSPEDAIRVEGHREATDQVSMANAITSLRFCATHDWSRFVESVSQVETILHHDPVGIYGRMDFASRDRYRQSLEALADGTGEGQVYVARQSVEAARRSESRLSNGRDAHVGYYLIGPGRAYLEEQTSSRLGPSRRLKRFLYRHPTPLYLLPIVAVTTLLVLVAAWYAQHAGGSTAAIVVASLLALLPSTDLATAAVQRLAARLSRPRRLPRLDLEHGIPEEGRTMVIIPTLFGSVAAVEELLAHLEVHALGNPDPRLHFALLSDFTDAAAQHMPGDQDDPGRGPRGHCRTQHPARPCEAGSLLPVPSRPPVERQGIALDGLGAQARQDRGVQPAPARRYRHQLPPRRWRPFGTSLDSVLPDARQRHAPATRRCARACRDHPPSR